MNKLSLKDLNVEDLVSLPKEDLFYVLKDEYIFSNSTGLSLKYHNLLTLLKNEELLFSLYTGDSFWRDTYIESSNGSEYYFDIGMKNLQDPSSKCFKDVFNVAHSLYISQYITYEDLRKRVIFLYENNIFGKRYSKVIEEINQSIEKNKIKIAMLQSEKDSLASLMANGVDECIKDRLQKCFEEINRNIVDEEHLLLMNQDRLDKISNEMNDLLIGLESEYKLAIKIGSELDNLQN